MSTFHEIRTAFENANTVDEYKAAKRLCRQLTTADCYALVDAAIDSRLRVGKGAYAGSPNRVERKGAL